MIDKPVTVVTLLRRKPGQLAAFEAFEAQACAIAARHGGRLERRIAGLGDNAGDNTGYDEVHIWYFRNQACFDDYRADPGLSELAGLRTSAITETTVLTGHDTRGFAGEPPARRDTVIGLDHIYLSVSDLGHSQQFYDPIMAALGFRKGQRAISGEPHAHYFNPHLQISLRPARVRTPHDPYAPGLHHLCLQTASRAAIDQAHAALATLGIEATTPTTYPQYNPDYYATFFNDPDGLRFELVTRTPHRDAVAQHWHGFSAFLHPLAASEGERVGVFHIATEDDWRAAQASSEYRPGSFSADGFIHCSTRPQVLATANRYYRGTPGLVLLRLDPTKLQAELRYEAPVPMTPGRESELFPHLYGPVNLDAVTSAMPLASQPDGTFEWPEPD